MPTLCCGVQTSIHTAVVNSGFRPCGKQTSPPLHPPTESHQEESLPQFRRMITCLTPRGVGGLKVEAKLASLGRILAHSAPTRSTNNPTSESRGTGFTRGGRRNSRIRAPDSTRARALCNARHAFPTTISSQSLREPARGWRTTLPDAETC